MSKKNLNADGLLNELRGGSSFFPRQPQTLPVQEQPSLTTAVKSSTPVRDVPPVLPVPTGLQYGSSPVPRTVVPPRRKIKQRHPFDIYQDQLDTLRHISAEERMQGGIGSMSAMVREAIDKFIGEKKRKGK